MSQGWGTCPSRLHQHIFLGKVNVGQCHEFWSNSKSKLHRCENFSVIFLPIFGYLDSVKLISLLGTVLNFLNTFFNQIKRTTKIEKLEAPNVVLEIYKQSLVKNQPINHKVDNFHVLTKVPHNTRET